MSQISQINSNVEINLELQVSSRLLNMLGQKQSESGPARHSISAPPDNNPEVTATGQRKLCMMPQHTKRW